MSRYFLYDFSLLCGWARVTLCGIGDFGSCRGGSTCPTAFCMQSSSVFKSTVFIFIAKHNGGIDYCVSDGSRIIVTRQNIAFDPHLYPFHQKPLSAPAWQTFHNLTQAAALGRTQQMTPSTEQPAAQENVSSESDIDDSLCLETEEVNDNTITEEQADRQDSSESDVGSDDDDNESIRISSRQKRPPAIFKARPENPIAARKATLEIFSNNTILTKNIRMTVTHSLKSLSPNDFQDTVLSTERSLNIIQQVTTTLSRIKTAIQK